MINASLSLKFNVNITTDINDTLILSYKNEKSNI